MKKLLFDMDDTLTVPRQKITQEMKNELIRLLEHEYEIGIVTGSPKEYIEEQLDGLVDWNITLFPCNGTQVWEPQLEDGVLGWVLKKEVRLVDNTNLEKVKTILKQILREMNEFHDFDDPQGDTIQQRPSMLNFCPIGRQASQERREWFKQHDKEHNFRRKYLETLRQELNPLGFDVVLGGVTSFDIFPTGWDKTYSLNHFQRQVYDTQERRILWRDNITFFGNAMFEDGNDACMLGTTNVTCIHVQDSQETLEILKKLK